MTKNNTINSTLPFTVANGGTNAASFTAYSVICAGTTTTGTLQNVSGVGTSNQVLLSNGASALPTWQTVGIGSGKVLQVVSTAKTSTFTTTSSSFTAITGLSVSITPSASSSKVLIMIHVNGANASGAGFVEILRGATPICIGDANGANIRSTSGTGQGAAQQTTTASMIYLDSPATTSATTYSVSATVGGGGGTFYINESSSTTGSGYASYASTITVWEISA